MQNLHNTIHLVEHYLICKCLVISSGPSCLWRNESVPNIMPWISPNGLVQKIRTILSRRVLVTYKYGNRIRAHCGCTGHRYQPTCCQLKKILVTNCFKYRSIDQKPVFDISNLETSSRTIVSNIVPLAKMNPKYREIDGIRKTNITVILD